MEQNHYFYNNDQRYCILGIDPGKNLGITILEVEIKDNEHIITNVETKTIYLDLSITNENIQVQRTNYLYSIITEILSFYNPIAICLETVFKSRFANAVIQLSQYTITIERAIYNYNPYIKLYKLAPRLIKKIVSNTGDATKDDMLSTVNEIKELKPFLYKFTTEHEVDSLAMAYIVYNKIKNLPECIFMNLNISF